MPNIRRSLSGANLFAPAMASCRCVCRKATVYFQIGCGQSTETALPKRYSICGKHCDAEYTRKFKHLNREEIQTNRYNSLRNFSLQSFSKNLTWFRCSGKGEHLNLTARQDPAVNPLTAYALQDFQQLCPRFRS